MNELMLPDAFNPSAPMDSTLALLLSGALFAGLVLVVMYNALVSKQNRVDNAFASIDVQLKKRHDLVPNLVEVVRGYASHERELLSQVAALRTRASAEPNPRERLSAETELTFALGRVVAISESYPQLKANQNFLQLQAALNEVEEQLSASRRAYNAAVTDLNDAVSMFPTNLVASAFAVRRRDWFTASETERKSVPSSSMAER